MQKIIVHEFYFPHPPALVWEYLTMPELIALWLMPNDFKLQVGHRFTFKTKSKFPLGFDGTVYGEVLAFTAPKKLVYAWRGGMSEQNPSLNSVVTWTLTEENKGTRLRLEHSGFSGLKNYLPYLIMNKGWLKIGKRLVEKMDLFVV